MTPCWRWLIAVFMLAAGPAFACSCGGEGWDATLEQRLDSAERVQLLRIEAAILRQIPEGAWGREHDKGSFYSEPYSRGATQYGYRVLEVLKGETKPLPRIWTENLSNCGRHLGVGDFVIAMYGREDQDIWVSHCNMKEMRSFGNHLAGRSELLDSMRAYLEGRKPIHACDNFVPPPAAIEPICLRRWQQTRANDLYELRPLWAPRRARP
ncbi:MAG TPA: hypothetical protein PLG89_05825 [Arenimonas sp.]|nr:hypothetical protein [Arenimonas sp.]